MDKGKTTKKGHIRYSIDLKKYLKSFILGNKSDTILWNAISRENKENPNSTLKNAFNPNKERLTINVVQSLLVFVIKKRIDNSDVLDKLNSLLARFCFEDFSKKDKKSILDILQKKTLQKFTFYKKDYSELLIFDEKIFNEDYNPVQRYKGFDIKLKNIVVEVEGIKEQIEYKKKVSKNLRKNEIKSKIRAYNEIIDEILPVFVGRKFVFDKVDEFVSKNSKGYFYIKANPGIGKTSLAIKLVEEKGYSFHIINPQHNGADNSVKDFISNICAQLIIKYELPIEQFPEDYDLDGDFLYSVLRLVSEKNTKNEKIVIVVDGLDELKQEELTFFAKETILYLPKTLPQNIFFVVTMRKLFKKGIKLPAEIDDDLVIEDLGEENIKDVREYIKIASNDKLFEQYIEKHKISKKEFLKTLEKKSEGNFMYLKHIFREILRGDYKDIKLEELPQGLEGYYKEHWDRMMAVSDEEKEVKLKTIYVLSDMKVPISRGFLKDIIKTNDENVTNLQIQEIINDWNQFLNITFDERDKRNKYTFYHKSFLDFLASDELIKAIGSDYSKKAKSLKLDYYLRISDEVLGKNSK